MRFLPDRPRRSRLSPRPRRSGLIEPGLPGIQVSGIALAEIGLAIAPRRPLTAAVVYVEAL